MNHAIAELEKSLATLLHNEPIHRAGGDIETADLEAVKITEFQETISLLKAFMKLRDLRLFTPGGFVRPEEPTTIRGWLETLPDGYRERALANMPDDGRGDCEAEDLGDAVANAFNWAKSPEGYSFWRVIRTGEGFPPIPES